jgi:hypothetical protein
LVKLSYTHWALPVGQAQSLVSMAHPMWTACLAPMAETLLKAAPLPSV